MGPTAFGLIALNACRAQALSSIFRSVVVILSCHLTPAQIEGFEFLAQSESSGGLMFSRYAPDAVQADCMKAALENCQRFDRPFGDNRQRA